MFWFGSNNLSHCSVAFITNTESAKGIKKSGFIWHSSPRLVRIKWKTKVYWPKSKIEGYTAKKLTVNSYLEDSMNSSLQLQVHGG